MQSQNKYYSTGFRKEISSTHTWRTIDNCMGFMVPYIRGTESILDVGCGPGTITIDCARKYLEAKVVGIDTLEELANVGKKVASEQGLSNVKFEVGSVMSLPYDDESFDIVYVHQLLLHLPEPIGALKEMTRVVKPGGLIFAREADLDSTIVYPMEYESIKYFFNHFALGESTDTTGGRKLKEWALESGTEAKNIVMSSSTQYYSSVEERKQHRRMYAERLRKSKEGASDKYTVKQIEDSWELWEKDERSLFVMIMSEIVIRV